MAIERISFRYEVILPLHMEPVDRFGKHLGAERRQIISADEEEKLNEYSQQMETWLEKIFDANSSARYIFYVLNHRLNFMWWLIDHLLESDDPREATDFKFRCREDEKFNPPKSKKESTIGPLIIGLYGSIDDYIHELLSVVDSSLEGKVFIYSNPDKDHFDDKEYVKNLDELVKDGVLPAKILRTLIDKLNLQETVLKRLKEAFKKISSPEIWPLQRVQLDQGGFNFLSAKEYELFCHMDIFMEIDGAVIVCRGKVVSQDNSEDEALPYKTGVQFDFLTSEQKNQITLFEQRHELRDAMMMVAIS